MKTCTKCGLSKDHTEFHRDKWTKDGWHPSCIACNARIVPFTQDQRDRRTTNCRRHSLKKLYGLSLEEYDGMVRIQNGLCAICLQPETRVAKNKRTTVRSLSVDHSHRTGKNRGLLCHRCNVSIGQFEDDIDLLKAAIKYLEKYS